MGIMSASHIIATFILLNGIVITQIPEIMAIINPAHIKYISVNSETYEKKFEIKMIKNKNRDCVNIDSINLSNMNLKFIKNDIIRSDAIKELSLKNNYLENVPNNILDYVPNLTCLNLRGNKINVYNDNAVSMHHSYLQILDLSNQDMSSIKQVIAYHSEIEDITDESEDIYKYMVFNSTSMYLPSLEHLDISENDISALSWDFNISFPRLTNLYLTNIYAEKVEPNFFNKVPPSLKVLHLENNKFQNLSLGNLMNVEAIYLDGNTQLKSLDISSSKLRMLSLSNCLDLTIRQIDFIRVNTPYLEYLDLTKNNLYTMSDFYFKTDQLLQLQILLLDSNKFSEIPFLTLQRLVELSLNYNMIIHIVPNTFIHLASLKKLSLKGNNIENIKDDSFFGLRKLEYLNLSENKLRTLSQNWLLPIISLQYLNLNSNQFTSISDLSITYPFNSTNYLKHLFISKNTFSRISTIDLEFLPPYITVYIA